MQDKCTKTTTRFEKEILLGKERGNTRIKNSMQVIGV